MSKTLKLNTTYEEALKNVKPFRRTMTQGELSLLSTSRNPIGLSLIPPLNTNIQFQTNLETFKPRFNLRTLLVKPPETWNWNEISQEDSERIKFKKNLITKPMNQGMCGSCWAVALATTISDVFVVSDQVDKNPEISTTYIMSCFKNAGDGCNGGNPGIGAVMVNREGCVSSNCISYDVFCTSRNNCLGDGAQHFDAQSIRLPTCGCINPNLPHPLFFIKNVRYHSRANTETIKNIIINSGPVIAGYHIYRNFMSGRYRATNGVYLENFNYATNRFDLTQTNSENWIGAHAVVIVGWGSTMLRGKKVEYWIARNSWGTNWGERGFFKMAFYGTDPETSNQYSQFDRAVRVETPMGIQNVGGIFSFERWGIKRRGNKFEKTNIESNNPMFNKIFDIKRQPQLTVKLEEEQRENYGLYILIIFIILIIVLVIQFLRRRTTS